MKRLKSIFFALGALLLISLTSCELFETKVYMIRVTTPVSMGYNDNVELQFAVDARLAQLNSESLHRLRDEEEAIDWFYSVCAELESPYFTSDMYYVSNGTYATLSLIGDGDAVETRYRTITFYSRHYYY